MTIKPLRMGVIINMGISLAITSSVHGSGKTVFTYILAQRLFETMIKEASILICCACMKDSDIGKIVGVDDDCFSLEDLINVKVSSNVNIDIEGLMHRMGNVYFIDTSKSTPLFVRENAINYQAMFNQLKHSFDVIITDTSSDSSNPLTTHILKNSDHAFNITVQDIHLLEKKTIVESKAATHIINKYTNIYPDKKELTKLLDSKKLFTLPYCNQLQEMKNRQRLHQYSEANTDYMKDLDKLITFLVKSFDLPMAMAGKDKGKNNGLINLFRRGGKQ